MLDDLLAERAVREASRFTHLPPELLGLADGAHAVMDAARAETAPAPNPLLLAEQDVFRWRYRTFSSRTLRMAAARRQVLR